jgi:hypothetical protein
VTERIELEGFNEIAQITYVRHRASHRTLKVEEDWLIDPCPLHKASLKPANTNHASPASWGAPAESASESTTEQDRGAATERSTAYRQNLPGYPDSR